MKHYNIEHKKLLSLIRDNKRIYAIADNATGLLGVSIGPDEYYSEFARHKDDKIPEEETREFIRQGQDKCQAMRDKVDTVFKRLRGEMDGKKE